MDTRSMSADSLPLAEAVSPVCGYVSDARRNTIIEKLSEGALAEFLPGCVRTQHILDELATVLPNTLHPQIVRESVLRDDFVQALGDYPRNEGRGDHIPRFLLLDLDSFRAFFVGGVVDER